MCLVTTFIMYLSRLVLTNGSEKSADLSLNHLNPDHRNPHSISFFHSSLCTNRHTIAFPSQTTALSLQSKPHFKHHRNDISLKPMSLLA